MLFGAYRSNVMTDTPLLQATSSKLKAQPLMSQSPNILLVVLGMHRNGTSAVAGLFSKLGARMGPRLMPPAGDNPHGFWEHSEIVECHDRLLSELGSSWSTPSPLPSRWWTQPQATACYNELQTILRRDFSDGPISCIKDPRMCMLLPLWKPLFEDLECDARYVIVCRHPSECARSLAIRNGISESISHRLWLNHFINAERETRETQRTIVTFDQLLADPRSTMERISADLNIAWPLDDGQRLNEALRFLNPSGRHHRASGKEPLPKHLEMAYGALQKAANCEPMTLKRDMDQLHSLIEDCAYLLADQDSIARDYRQLEAEHRQAKADYDQLEAEHRHMKANNGQLDREHRQTKADYGQLETEHRRIKTDHHQLAIEYRQTKTVFRNLETAYRRLEADYRQQQLLHKKKTRKLREKALIEKTKRRKELDKIEMVWITLEAFRSSWAWTCSKPIRLLENSLGRTVGLPHRPKSTPSADTLNEVTGERFRSAREESTGTPA